MKQRKDGRWRKSITINGKVKVFYSSESTERKAEQDINRQMVAYKDELKNGRTFADVAREWETESYESLSNGTVKSYSPSVNELVDRFGSMRFSEITAQSISAYLKSLASNDFSAKTIAKRRSVLNMIVKHAISCGDASSNPVPDLIVPKGKKKVERRALTSEERRIVLDNKSNGYWGLWAFFTVSTGCRRGEAFALTYGDIDQENMTVRIHSTVEHVSNVGRIKNHTKTDAGMRVVPITDEIVRLLGVSKHKKGDLVFPDPLNGGIITNDHITSGWDSYKESVGIDEVSPHMLRHTYATILYDANVDIKSAQYLMGHKDINTTMKIYTHLSEERKEITASKVRDQIKSFFE